MKERTKYKSRVVRSIQVSDLDTRPISSRLRVGRGGRTKSGADGRKMRQYANGYKSNRGEGGNNGRGNSGHGSMIGDSSQRLVEAATGRKRKRW